MNRHASDEGFTLVEVVVAVAIFVMVTAAALTALIAALNTVRENADRVQAASIARGVVEDLQAQGADALLDRLGASIYSAIDDSSLSWEEPPYTVTVSATWASINQLVDPCVRGELSARTYLLASVSVSGGTLLTPQVIDAVVPRLRPRPSGGEPGSIAVRVVDAKGVGVQGVTVDITSPTAIDGVTGTPGVTRLAYTDENGCALEDGLGTAVDYVVSISKAGFVTPNLDPTASITVAVDAGINTPVGFVYDSPGLITFVNADDTYALLPTTTFPIILVPAASLNNLQFNAPVSVFPDTYQAWIGDCSDSGRRQATVSVAADDSATVALEGNLLQVLSPPTAALAMRHVPPTIDDTTLSDLCRGVTTVDMATMDDSGGLLSFNVPTGSWIFSATVGADVTDDTVLLGAATPSPCSVDLGLASSALALAKQVKSAANNAVADDSDVTTTELQTAWAEVSAAATPRQGVGDDTVIVAADSITIRPLFGRIVAEHVVRLEKNASNKWRAVVDDTAGPLVPIPPLVLADTCPVVTP